MRSYGLEDTELSIRCWLLDLPVYVEPISEVGHWFKEMSGFHVAWQDYIIRNILRVAALHFAGAQLSRILDQQQGKPEFAAAMGQLISSDLWERVRLLRNLRVHNTDWFCRKFEIDL